jgi:FAD binding domain-containing protein
MKKVKAPFAEWENEHHTFKDTISALYTLGNELSLEAIQLYNDATAGIQQILADAVNTNTPVRALGSGWSWSKVAHVNGIMLNTQMLNAKFTMSAASTSPKYQGDPGKLFFVQCGMAVWELNQFLKGKKLSLKTSGASNGQTIAGVLSTGAHGSAFQFGSISEFVVGLHIIVSPGKHVYLERERYPVVNKNFTDRIGATLICRDDLFDAALVSFGSFGIIHGVMVEAEDIYLLESYEQRIPYDDKLIKVMESLDFSNANFPPHGNEKPWHLQVILNQFDMENGAYVTTMYKRPYRTDYTPPPSDLNKAGPGEDAAAIIGIITDKVPMLIHTLLNTLIKQVNPIDPENKPRFGTSGEIFSNTSLRGKVISSAIGIPTTSISRVVKILLEENENTPYAGIFSLRFVKKSTATLGFTKFDPTCVIEMDGSKSEDSLKFYTKIWNRLEAEQIPYTFHWGKMLELNPQRIQKMYDDSLDKWKAARLELLGPEMIKVFSNSLTQQWGLDNVIAGSVIT